MSHPMQARRQMIEYLHKVLSSTGEFSLIEPHYKFGNNKTLNSNRDGQIYCEISKELIPSKQKNGYLIIVHSDERMPESELRNKLIEASGEGIYTVHLLFRYQNSKSNPDTEGPLFRRFILESERSKPRQKGSHKAVYSRESISHYPKERRENFRLTRRLEREFIPSQSGGSVLYYQPESEKLKEEIKRYAWGGVILKGLGAFGRYREEVSETIKEPILIEDFSFFTLSPMMRFSEYSRAHFLIGDLIGLPDIKTTTKDEMLIRRNLAKLEHLLNNNLGKDETLAERISIQLRHAKESPLLGYFNALLARQQEKISEYVHEPEYESEEPTQAAEKVAEIRKIEVPSRSRQGKKHFIAERRNLITDEKTYTCSCEDFRFNKHPKGDVCGHIDEILENDTK